MRNIANFENYHELEWKIVNNSFGEIKLIEFLIIFSIGLVMTYFMYMYINRKIKNKQQIE